MQKIICGKGRCMEEGTIESEFATIHDKSNIVDKIEMDLLKKMIR